MIKAGFLWMFVLLLAACGSEGHETAKKAVTKTSGVIPEAQLDALKEAKGVEKVLYEADQNRRKHTDDDSY